MPTRSPVRAPSFLAWAIEPMGQAADGMAEDAVGGADGEAGVLRRALALSAEDLVALDGVIAAIAPRLGSGTANGIASTLDRGEPLSVALGVSADVLEALYGRAHALFDTGRHEKAARLFAALTVLDGRRADHWLGLGICLTMSGDRGAVPAFATAATLRPDWYAPAFHAADAHARAGEWGAAETALRRRDACTERPPATLAPEIDRLRLAVAVHANGPHVGGDGPAS